MALAGKTLQGKRKTRGIDDPVEQMESFLTFYPQFSENLNSLDGGTKDGFVDRGNELLDAKNIGDTLNGGDVDDVKIELDDLEKPDLKVVMDFLITEQAIEFDDEE